MVAPKGVRTWIEVDKKALKHNLGQFLKIIPKRTRLMAIIKSNAYGHGLVLVAKFLAESRIWNLKSKNFNSILDSKFYFLDSRLWFGVDSIVEALRLRREGVKNSILVLGYTLPARISDAAEHDISITVSTFETLHDIARAKKRPAFHLKTDTGMHRQGFFSHDISRLVRALKKYKLKPEGIFTHFASAKDVAYPTHTYEQLKKFTSVCRTFKKAGFQNIIRHAAASGGTLLFPKSHLDMVRVGMGLYGYWPSEESKIKNQELQITLKPVLTWKTIIGETKEVPKGAYVGYDLTERVHRKTKIAILPIGYWHGYGRGLSSIGEVLIHRRRAKVLGRVSMDMVVVDITDIPRVRVGDEVVLIGAQGAGAVWASELGLKIGTSQYEILTRINPLIRRVQLF